MKSKKWLWGLWLLAMLGLAAWLLWPLYQQEDQQIYLAGDLTSGHHQIGLECTACHTSPFGGPEVLQEACVNCHGAELKSVSDSHPRKKFVDPRNADRVEKLDARYCVTCHKEHQLERTHPMGVTLPQDFCFECHQDIGEERETHRDLGFETCASSGCHNFHDNLALYEDFLLKHAADPWLGDTLQVLARQPVVSGVDRLSAQQQDAPEAHAELEAIHAWSLSVHAEAGVNCSDCHQPAGVAETQWLDSPGMETCSRCHESQVNSFQQGKHGMRLAQGLSAMSPHDARIAMLPEPAHDSLTCNSCHSPHESDTRQAAVQACQGCHDSEHVRNYENSPHARVSEQAFQAGFPEQAVTCATCHMPRVANSEGVVEVNHNQSENLRPNEKMIRPVCMQCHGLGFAIDALADPALIEGNFTGRPAQHIPSIDMALDRAAKAPVLDDSYQ